MASWNQKLHPDLVSQVLKTFKAAYNQILSDLMLLYIWQFHYKPAAFNDCCSLLFCLPDLLSWTSSSLSVSGCSVFFFLSTRACRSVASTDPRAIGVCCCCCLIVCLCVPVWCSGEGNKEAAPGGDPFHGEPASSSEGSTGVDLPAARRKRQWLEGHPGCHSQGELH